MVQGRIVIDTERCKGCELCISVCPQHVIRVASAFNAKGYHPAALVDPAGACTGCAVCAIICPTRRSPCTAKRHRIQLSPAQPPV